MTLIVIGICAWQERETEKETRLEIAVREMRMMTAKKGDVNYNKDQESKGLRSYVPDYISGSDDQVPAHHLDRKLMQTPH